jgi:hypothetical protein
MQADQGGFLQGGGMKGPGSFRFLIADVDARATYPLVHNMASSRAYYFYYHPQDPAAMYDHEARVLTFPTHANGSGFALSPLQVEFLSPMHMEMRVVVDKRRLCHARVVAARLPPLEAGAAHVMCNDVERGAASRSSEFPVVSIKAVAPQTINKPYPRPGVAASGPDAHDACCWLPSTGCTGLWSGGSALEMPFWEIEYDGRYIPSPLVLMAFAYVVSCVVISVSMYHGTLT